MNSTQINCFLEAAKCRSFSKSAANLFISQSTFSRNISMLEEELGLTLFSRNSFHGIELTESGKIMEEALTNGRKIYLAAIEKARQLEHEAHTHLTLGLLEGQLLDDTLGALISRFRMSFLNVTFSIRRDTYNRLISSLQSGETDIVYMPEWQFQDIDQLQVMKLGELETLLVVPKRLISPPEDRVYSLTEFSNLPFITINDNDSSTPGNMLRELFDSLRISPPVTETNSIREQIEKVETGEGAILINPNNYICFSPNVYCIKIKELLPQPFAIAWKKVHYSESVSLFRHFLNMTDSNHKQNL